MRYQSKPQYSDFLTDPADSFKNKSTEPSPSTVQKEDKKEAEFQYNLELLCSSEEVKNYNLKSFLLASTEQEKDTNNSWAESTNQDSTNIILTTSVYVDEPKILHYQFSGSKSSAFSYKDIKPVKKGNTSHTESFIPIKPSVQIGERLGWPTEGYFYHFIDDALLNEYKILGDNKWAFSVTASTNELLTDTLLSEQAMTTILLPYKINGETIERQHILYKKEKITNEQWDNDVNANWLDEHACLLNMKDVVSARSEPILEKETQEGDNSIYIVTSGDTLSKIAHKHGVTLDEIIELNPKYKTNPNAINIGDKVIIETHQKVTTLPDLYVCQIDPETNQRETWVQIAAKYNLAPKALLELNSCYNNDPTALAVGDELVVESKKDDTAEKETRNTLPAEDITTDKKVYAFANTQCTADDDIHMYVKPLVDLGDANKNTPVVKTNKIVLQSKLLSNLESLELLAKDKGTLLKKGSKGPAVKAIQEALLTMNIDIGSTTADQVFGNNTYNAIKQFQQEFIVKNTLHKDYQLGNADGVIGRNTLLALDEALQTEFKIEAKNKSLSENGKKLLKEIEELRLKPYDDQNGKDINNHVKGATIGYGYLIPKDEWDTYKNGITEAQADNLFLKALKPFEKCVFDSVKTKQTENQYDALIILCYNIGEGNFKSSSVLKLVNGLNAPAYSNNLSEAWLAWNKSQGEVMQGLINRRNAEIKMYNQGVYERW